MFGLLLGMVLPFLKALKNLIPKNFELYKTNFLMTT